MYIYLLKCFPAVDWRHEKYLGHLFTFLKEHSIIMVKNNDNSYLNKDYEKIWENLQFCKITVYVAFHNIYASWQKIYRTCKFHWAYRQGPSWITRFTAVTQSVGTGRICKPCKGSTNTSWCFKTLLGYHPGTFKFSEKRMDITHNTCKFFSYNQKSL